MTALDTLRNLVLAPYILKAMALIRIQRKVGGNQFRHCFMVPGILLDYKLFMVKELTDLGARSREILKILGNSQ